MEAMSGEGSQVDLGANAAPYLTENTTVFDDNITTTQIQSMPWLQLYFVPIFYAIVTLVGCFGNGLVIAVLIAFNNMKTIPNIYILNLAIVDFMFSLSIPFIAYQVATSSWPFGAVMCKLLGGFDGLNQYASIYTLALMSADRYVAVVYPLSSMRYRTKTIARLLCAGVWFLSMVFSLPLWIFQVSTPIYDNVYYCITVLPDWEHSVLAYNVYSFVLGFIIPLIIIVTCYAVLMIQIFANTQPISNAGSAAQRAQKRVSVLVVTVIVAFILCWLPYYVIQMIHTFRVMTPTMSLFYTISICLCYINSCINPFMYTFIGENFKRNIVKLLHCERDTKYSHTGGTYRMHSVTNDTGIGQTSPGSTVVTDTTAFIDKRAGNEKNLKKLNGRLINNN
ncbi:somatostatin receptor type 5-like [Amphiura filiformis]|uniref:somatostatin receptor type 5-like n=1 Tax=Amphiura filiformis TaxID=82378 RepID=UPI003B2120DF